METNQSTRQIGETAKSTLPSFEHIAACLEKRGWTREVMDSLRGKDDSGALADDFSAGVRAVQKMLSIPKKGLIVNGEVGCGKSKFIRAVTGYTGYPYLFDMNSSMDREILDPNGDYRDSYNTLFNHDIIIDDLGVELRKHYGEHNYSEARDFICEYHIRGKGRLHIVTNLRANELKEAYGARFVDRLKDVGVPLRFWGKSKRKWEVS